MQKVGLLGFYAIGNFGDDLAAALFGCALRDAGVPFFVYRLCEPYASAFGFDVADSRDELLSAADVLLWGGGGLLVSWPALRYSLQFPGVAGELGGIVTGAIAKGIGLIGSSVGGDGSCPDRLSPAYKESFAAAAAFLSVRNPQDLGLLHRLQVPGSFHHDVLWLVSERFPHRAKRSGLKIGIDLYTAGLLAQRQISVLPLLHRAIRARRDCEFFLIDSTNRSRKGYRGLGLFLSGPNVRRYQFGELEEDLEFVSSLDLLVSSRLHLPMVALQYGVPSIFLLPEKKTELMLENVGLQDVRFSQSRVQEFQALLSDLRKLEKFLSTYRFPDIETLRTDAREHFVEAIRAIRGGTAHHG